LLFAVLVAAAIVAAGASARGAGTGELLFGSCVSEDGTGGACADGKALDASQSVAISKDGKNAYVPAANSNAVAVLARDKTTGTLSQLAGTAGCISEDGTGGDCADGKAIDTPVAVAVSRDGKNVYAVSANSSAVAVFARDPATGALTQLAGTAGCISETGSGGNCVDGKALVAANDVAVSPDGKHVYVASLSSDAIAVFSRDKNTGALTQLAGTAGCISEDGSGGDCADGKALDGPYGVTVSGDGKHVYVASSDSDAVAVFSRDKNTGALAQLAGTGGCISETGQGGDCADGKALDGPTAVTVTTDGKQVYVSSLNSDAVAVLSRTKKTGALTQLAGTAGCISETGTGGDCTDGKALDAAYDVVVPTDGKNVYVVATTGDAIAAFARNKSSGALTQLAGTAGCISEDGSGGDCVDATALDGASGLAGSADGKHLYVASAVSDAVVALTRG
jgi:6-phosphogluconolactonase (cycloisomerase 2 family)